MKIFGYAKVSGTTQIISGVHVYDNVSGTTVITDGNGYYEIQCAQTNQKHQLTFSYPTSAFANNTKTVNVVSSDIECDFNPLLQTGYAHIAGTILTSSGAPLPKVTLTVVHNTSTWAEFTSATDGTYRIWVASAGGSFTVTPTLDTYTFTPDHYDLVVSGAKDGKDFTAAGGASLYSISGQVTCGGLALASATISITGPTPMLVTTDGLGNYIAPLLQPGDYWVTPSAYGYSFAPTYLHFTLAANATGKDFVATVTIPTYKITGKVQDGSGTALSGILITMQGDSRTAITNASGIFVFSGLASPGAYTVQPVESGFYFTPSYQTVNIAGADVDLTSTPFVRAAGGATHTLSGYVKDAAGNGISGVVVDVGGGTYQGYTDGTGLYSFVVPDGTYIVAPTKSHWTFTPATRTAVVSGADLPNQNFLAAALPTYELSGTITAGGVAIANIYVTVTDSSGTVLAYCLSDAAGKWSLVGLYPGSYTARPSSVGYTYAPDHRDAVIVAASIGGLDFAATSTSGHKISGHVRTGAGVGVGGVTVSAGAAQATTDGAGYFELPGLSDATYTVTPAWAGHTFTPPSRNVTLSGADSGACDFVVSTGTGTRTISGTVRTGTGDPIVGVNVTAGAFTAQTDAYGAFSISGLDPAVYTVTPGKAGYTFSPANLSVDVTSNDQADQDFTGTPATGTGGHSISGVVSGAGGAALPGVTIACGTLAATTDAYGAYVLEGVQDGPATLYPIKAGYRFSPVALDLTMAGADVTGKNFSGSTVTPTYPILPYRPRNVESGQMMSLDAEGIWADLVALLSYMTNITDQQISEFAQIGPQKIRSSLSPQTANLFADLKKMAADIKSVTDSMAASENYSAWNVTLPSEEGVEVSPSGDSGSGGAVAVRNGKIRMMGREISVTEHRLPETPSTYLSPTSAYSVRATYDSGLVLDLLPLTGTALGPSDQESKEYVVGTVQSATDEKNFVLNVPAGCPALGAHCVVLDGDLAGVEFYLAHFDTSDGTVVLMDALTATLAAGVHLGIWLDDPDLRDTPGTLGGISSPTSMLLAIIWTGAAGAPPLVRKRTNIGGEAGTRIHELPWSGRLDFNTDQGLQTFTFTGESRPIRAIWGRAMLYDKNSTTTPEMCVHGPLPTHAIMIDGSTAKGVNIRIAPKDITIITSPSHLAILDPEAGTPVPAKSGCFKLYVKYAP